MPPRKPYAFDDMLSDVLDFSYLMLSVNGRLSMWVPTANDEDVELLVPTHPGLELVSVCVQPFNKCTWFQKPQQGSHLLISTRGTTVVDLPEAAQACCHCAR